MAAKRALIFSFVYYPRFIGGAEVAVKEITDRIKTDDIEFHLIALRFDSSLPKREKVGNVMVHRIGWTGRNPISADSLPFYLHINKYAYPFLALLKARSLHKKESFDLIWAIMANYSGFGALFFKMFHKEMPFLLTLQEGDSLDYIEKESLALKAGPVKIPVKFFMLPIFKMIFSYADRIQAISDYLADWGKSMGGKDPVVVPNGVDVALFSKGLDTDEKKVIEAGLDKKSGDIFLITASRLVVKNAVDDVVSSLLFLPSNVKLLIVGQGYLESELRAQVKEAGLGERVIFTGFVSHKDLPKYLKASDIFIRPSLSEGFGNSFIEAMAARIPVIATRVGGIPDFLSDKKTGLFCEVSNPEDIARKVGIYMQDKNLRDEIIDNAYKMVGERYDWKNIAQQMREKAFDILNA